MARRSLSLRSRKRPGSLSSRDEAALRSSEAELSSGTLRTNAGDNPPPPRDTVGEGLRGGSAAAPPSGRCTSVRGEGKDGERREGEGGGKRERIGVTGEEEETGGKGKRRGGGEEEERGRGGRGGGRGRDRE